MKKPGLICLAIALFLLLAACAAFFRTSPPISWPEHIGYLEATCELDMAWRGQRYSGSMSVQLDYPDRLLAEVYGPFGNTVMYIRKDGEKFLFVTDEDRFTDEAEFERRFGIQISQFIDDIAMKGEKRQVPGESGVTYVQRVRYRVVYILGERESRMCLEGEDGRICLRFLEVNFKKGTDGGEGRSREM